jgi:hypothetical protein
VPLNAGNVLGAEDEGPADKWLHLVRRALLHPPPSSERTQQSSVVRTETTAGLRRQNGWVSFSDLLAAEDGRFDDTVSSEPDDDDSEASTSNPEYSSSEEEHTTTGGEGRSSRHHGYRLAASKQMVGIFLCVWVRADVAPSVTGLKVSCVGRGVMGYMGNKVTIDS